MKLYKILGATDIEPTIELFVVAKDTTDAICVYADEYFSESNKEHALNKITSIECVSENLIISNKVKSI